MTIEELEQYRGIRSNIAAIQEEIKAGYIPITSPNGRTDGGGFSNTPGNPTERAVFKIIKLKERLAEHQAILAESQIVIESWLLTLSDPEIESIIRWHYIMGLTWRETNTKVYGYPDRFRARKRIHRFFGKEK